MNKTIAMIALVVSAELMSCSPRIAEGTATGSGTSYSQNNTATTTSNAANQLSQTTLTSQTNMENVVPAAASAKPE